MAKIQIRPMNSAKYILLDEKYELEDVEVLVRRASSEGERVVVLDVNGGGVVVVPVGGTEPYTITEQSSRPNVW